MTFPVSLRVATEGHGLTDRRRRCPLTESCRVVGFTGVYRRAWAVPRLESDARVGPRMDAAGLYFMVGIIMHVFLKKR